MSNKTKEQTVPKWFKGMIYDQGETITNKYSNQSYTLNGLELSMYDFIMGTQYVMEVAPNTITPAQVSDFQKAITWFRKNNPEAYMVLLD
jgi:phosphoenolpyruvate carboxylase